MARILPSDRVLIVGSSGFGKSTLSSYLFAQLVSRGAQSVVVDPKGEWVIPGAVVCRSAEQLAAALEQADRIHYVPARGDREEWVAVYDVLSPNAGRRKIVIWTDEAQNVCVAGGSWAPHGMILVQTQGRFAELAHLVCSTRPSDIERTLRTEATHIFVMAGGLDHDDLKVLAPQLRSARLENGKPAIDGADDLQAVLASLPDYGYLWFDRRQRRVQLCPPLPEEYRRYGARVARQRAA